MNKPQIECTEEIKKTKAPTIIYVLEHLGGLSHLLTLRLLKHRDEKAILAVVSGDKEKLFLPKLVNNDLFDYVFEYKNCGLHEVSEQKTIEVLSAEYDELLGKHGIDIERIRLGYVFYDTLACFSLYLHSKNIDITTVEIEPDYIWKSHGRYSIMKKKQLFASQAYYDCVFRMLPTEQDRKAIKKVTVYPETEIKDNNYVERYDFVSNFLKIDDRDRYKVMQCFCNDLDAISDENISLLLPNSRGWLDYNAKLYMVPENISQFFYNQSKFNLLHAVICDYFYNKQYRLLAHSHPDGTIDHSIFEKDSSVRIDDEMPIEFLLYVPGMKIQEVLAIETNSADKIKSMIKTDRSLGKSFISAFHYMDKLYAIQKVINMCIENSSIFYYGIPEKTCVSLYDCNFSDHDTRQFIRIHSLQPFDSMNCYIINSSCQEHEPVTNKLLLLNLLREASTDSIVFFINSLREYCFVDMNNLDLLEYVTPLIIRRKPMRDSPLCEMYDQVVYVFSKNKRIHEALRIMSFVKQMFFSGVELLVSPVSVAQTEAERQKCIDFAIGFVTTQNIGICQPK